ncbi:hypothetical protein TSMEX_006316 [Taenia solium]|eukprot:TsM_000182300 transcript=TsM_000182300 gene=TsM_000182300
MGPTVAPRVFPVVVKNHGTTAESVLQACRMAARLLACLGGHAGERKHDLRGLKRWRSQTQSSKCHYSAVMLHIGGVACDESSGPTVQ